MNDSLLQEQMARFQHIVLARDVDLIDSVLHPDYALVLVHPESVVVPRSGWVAMLPDYIVHTWEVQAAYSNVQGDCASILQRVAMEATVAGQDRSGIFIVSDTWVREADDWLIWRRHSTPLSAPKMPTVEEI